MNKIRALSQPGVGRQPWLLYLLVLVVPFALALLSGPFYEGQDSEAVPPLRSALKDRNSAVRRASAARLGYLGPKARDAIPDLAECLNDVDDDVRNAAAFALLMIGGDANVALAGAIDNDCAAVRVWAAAAAKRVDADAFRFGLATSAVGMALSPDGATALSPLAILDILVAMKASEQPPGK